MSKAADAFRTISEVADDLEVPKHVLRFWENRFPQIKPMKRGGGRRYYRPADMELLRGIQHLLRNEAYTIKGVQKILREHGVEAVKGCWKPGRDVSRLQAQPAASERNGKRGGPASGGRRTGKPRSAPTRRDTIARIIRELQACRALLEAGGNDMPARRSRRRAAA
ncbi:MAG: MerR family transcriptional regulator [Hyphomicrobiaceae bacterium]